jgi:hypothetical protein
MKNEEGAIVSRQTRDRLTEIDDFRPRRKMDGYMDPLDRASRSTK